MTRRVLLLGGIDPSGGAGITADATVVSLHHAAPLPIALTHTEQNRSGFRRCLPVPAEQWCRALHAVLDDGPVHAVKVGMLADAVSVRGVARELLALRGQVPIVVDPVMIATSGHRLLDEDAVGALVERLVPVATVLTPNHPEAVALAGGGEVMAWAASVGRPVLITGGDVEGEEIVDRLVMGGTTRAWRGPRIAGGPFHGTGCTLASAVAAGLAGGAPLEEAVDAAITYVRARLAAAIRPGHGAAVGGPVRSPWSATTL